MLTRRTLLGLLAAGRLFAQKTKIHLRGILRAPAVLETGDGRRVTLAGDTETSAVIRDARLQGTVVEAVGDWAGDTRFAVEPIHERGMFAVRDGKLLEITYWCDVCAIRTYSPGKCMCCQEETQLDLRDPATGEADSASQNTTK